MRMQQLHRQYELRHRFVLPHISAQESALNVFGIGLNQRTNAKIIKLNRVAELMKTVRSGNITLCYLPMWLSILDKDKAFLLPLQR